MLIFALLGAIVAGVAGYLVNTKWTETKQELTTANGKVTTLSGQLKTAQNDLKTSQDAQKAAGLAGERRQERDDRDYVGPGRNLGEFA